jgi:hypothetical protein
MGKYSLSKEGDNRGWTTVLETTSSGTCTTVVHNGRDPLEQPFVWAVAQWEYVGWKVRGPKLAPLDRSTRCPERATASSRVAVSASGLSTTIEPNPIYTGAGPTSRNLTRSAGGSYCGASRKKNPQTSIYCGQSAGFGTSAPDQQ